MNKEMTRFMPEQWHIDWGEKIGSGINSYHTRIAIMDKDTDDPLSIIATLPYSSRGEANAKLLVAAPKLYNKLVLVGGLIGDFLHARGDDRACLRDELQEAVGEIEALLAEARGDPLPGHEERPGA